jgi:hypothetical protein
MNTLNFPLNLQKVNVKPNWFDTLNEALAAENLLESFPFGANIGYGENFRYDINDDTKNGRHVSIFRNSNGRYERPVHYAR